ncbi:MAG: hypothetical protein ACFB2Y_20605 [Fulvivirga sp.]
MAGRQSTQKSDCGSKENCKRRGVRGSSYKKTSDSLNPYILPSLLSIKINLITPALKNRIDFAPFPLGIKG